MFAVRHEAVQQLLQNATTTSSTERPQLVVRQQQAGGDHLDTSYGVTVGEADVPSPGQRTSQTIQIPVYDLLPYLEFKDISSTTKVMILSTLLRNNEPVLARTFVDASVMSTIICLLQSGLREVGAESLFAVHICACLVALLKHPEAEVQKRCLHVLAKISATPAIEACGEVYGGALAHLVTFLTSSDAEIVKWVCRILANTALQKPLVSAIVGADPCVPLVSLLSQVNLRLGSLH
ncbi:hypothetical protein B0H19DRAFT_1372565, partial [Mycena capillaripes]